MSRVELLASINEYKQQLTQVETALAICKESSELNSLENLKTDLTELLTLTEEQINELNDDADEATKSSDPFEDEMQLFLSEIRNVEQADTQDDSDDKEHINSNDRIETMKNVLGTIVGKKFAAPHTHSWGSKAYHNAFVCSLDDTTDYDEDITLENVKIKVLFINPTHREMIPCSYYLDGNCKFDADKCHFSHGELVLYNELREYKEPDFQLLQRVKYPVLAKQNDRIWYKGRLISSNFNDKTCKVKLEQSRKEISCDFHDVLPTYEDVADELSDSDSNDDDYDDMQRQVLVEKTLLDPSSDQALGEWEKYTKGFGSKMMQKFGYVLGTGLGNNGEGIVVPIQIQILPPGKSLDHCMELRERSNGDKDLFSVERKLKKQQKKQEQNNIRAYERDRQTSNVFNFINDNVFASLSSCSQVETTQVNQTNVVKNDFKNHSTKNLNVAGFKISEDIKKLEKDIQNIKDSMARQQRGTPVFNKLSSQLSFKSLELTNLKKSEKSVATEQIFRRDKSKLTIF